MRKTKIILAISSPALLFLLFCAKRPFAHMGAQGKIVTAKTNQPLQAELQLWVGCDPSICGHGNRYGNAHTNKDGTFEIKSNAQWNGNKYFLLIIPDSFFSPKTVEFSASKKQNVDLGEIYFK
jgi:hypothetical protein